jgi:2'-5' RNA ligase
MLYAIALILPEPFRSELTEIQRRFKDPNWNITLPPHVTIVPPFSLSKGKSLSEIVDAVSFTINALHCFNIGTGVIRKFNNKVSTIYLSVELSVELSELHSGINTILVPFINEISDYPKDFIPHVTLSGDVPESQAEEHFVKMKKLNLAKKFLCDKITLLKKSPEDKNWIPVRDFVLK